MKSVFMVAEKPSLAASVAKLLSDGKAVPRKGGQKSCPVHEWVGKFHGETVLFKMSSVCGHVMSLDFVGKYNSWDRVDPVELFTCPTEKKEANPKMKMPMFLAQAAAGCEYLVLWLDCDKEGENICFEVMDALSRTIRNVYTNNVTYRAKFSAITEKDIKHAMANLIRPNENEAKSVDARQELDLRIGCAFTRFQTKFFQGKYGDLDSSLISYGPCQTPTLGFCVQRHDEIQMFKPESFWYIQAKVGSPEITLEWSRIRLFEKDIVTMFLNKIKDSKEALVESVSTSESVRQRPQALNTFELMKAASSGLGLGPHTTMQIAERLYTQGYISYPRTETNEYPANFNIKEIVNFFKSTHEFGEHARDVLKEFTTPRKGKDCGDHPPITPMRAANRGEFDNDTWRVYDYVVRNFLGSVSKDMRLKSITCKLRIKEELFKATSTTLIEPGFSKVMPWLAFVKENMGASFVEGEMVKINSIKVNEGQTSPPDYLTESELITLMEQHGIGTDASIPVHINNISQRNYVALGSNRRLIPNTLGIVLVHGYQKIDPELVLPTMRAEVEKMLTLIATGKANFEAVLLHATEIFQLKFVYFVENILKMDGLFEASFSSLAESGKVLSRCGKCRRYMKYIQTKPARLHCRNCDDTYSLPVGGTVHVYRELKCPLDDFELLAYSSGAKGKSYPLCPYCFNNPPFNDMARNGGCNNCMHPTCQHSLANLGICRCDDCDRGVLVLDLTAAPKSYKLCCNKCDVIINVFKNASKVAMVDGKACDQCSVPLLSVTYKEDKTRFKDGAEEKTGCIFCTPEFTRLIEKHQAVADRPVFSGGRGGRGGSRGRGRGRGAGAGAEAKGGGDSRRGGRADPNDKMAQLASYFV